MNSFVEMVLLFQYLLIPSSKGLMRGILPSTAYFVLNVFQECIFSLTSVEGSANKG